MKKDISYYFNKSLFITATNTDVGKTYASEKFLRFFASKGFKVGYFKPCETGVIDLPIDGNKMLNITKELNPHFNVNINDVVPYQFKLPAAPWVAKGNTFTNTSITKSIVEKSSFNKKTLYLFGSCKSNSSFNSISISLLTSNLFYDNIFI